jgi:hypothetical protein
MAENPVGQTSGPFYAQLQVTASVFPHNKLGFDCLALWNKFKMNSNLDIEESDELCLRL